MEKNWHALHVELSTPCWSKKTTLTLSCQKVHPPQHQQRQQLWDLTAIAAGKNMYYTSSNTQKSKYRRQNSAMFCLQKQKKPTTNLLTSFSQSAWRSPRTVPGRTENGKKINFNFPILFRGNASVVPTRFSALLVVTSSSLDGSPRQNCWASSKSPFSYKK